MGADDECFTPSARRRVKANQLVPHNARPTSAYAGLPKSSRLETRPLRLEGSQLSWVPDAMSHPERVDRLSATFLSRDCEQIAMGAIFIILAADVKDVAEDDPLSFVDSRFLSAMSALGTLATQRNSKKVCLNSRGNYRNAKLAIRRASAGVKPYAERRSSLSSFATIPASLTD